MNNNKQIEKWAKDIISTSFKSIFTELRFFMKHLEFYFPLDSIIMSEEKPKETRGSLDDILIKDEFVNLRKKLSPNTSPKADELGELLDYFIQYGVEEIIVRYTTFRRGVLKNKSDHDYQHVKDLIDDIDNILSKYKITYSITGKYDSETNKIIVYYLNLSQWDGVTENDYKARLCMVLAHELFHAFHFKYLDSPIVLLDTSYYATVVKEALADYFAYHFCKCDMRVKDAKISLRDAKEVGDERYHYWERHLRLDDPYARAYYIENPDYNADRLVEDKAKKRFIDIWEESKRSMRKAYDMLVPFEDRSCQDEYLLKELIEDSKRDSTARRLFKENDIRNIKEFAEWEKNSKTWYRLPRKEQDKIRKYIYSPESPLFEFKPFDIRAKYTWTCSSTNFKTDIKKITFKVDRVKEKCTFEVTHADGTISSIKDMVMSPIWVQEFFENIDPKSENGHDGNWVLTITNNKSKYSSYRGKSIWIGFSKGLIKEIVCSQMDRSERELKNF